MITVNGRRRRSKMGYDAFADITDAPVVEMSSSGVTFGGELTFQQQADVRWRFTSVDDEDEARMRALDALRSGPETCACCVAVIGYLLGET